MATLLAVNPSDLGPRLRGVRVAQGVTQAALASIAGVGRQWLNAFEMGDKPSAPLDMVMRVATALEVTVTLAPPPPRVPVGPVFEVDLAEHLKKYDT